MIITPDERLWKKPLYPEFPRREYEDRFSRIRDFMAEEKVDILVLWDPMNIRYFTGFRSVHWPPLTLQCAVLLISVDKDPVIITPDFMGRVAEGFTFIDDIRLLHNPHVTGNLRGLPTDVANTVKELGYGKARVGIEAGFLGGMTIPRPVNDIDEFRAGLAEAEIVYAADLIWKCRVIKSPAEIEAITIATQADVEVYGDLIANFEYGWTEKDVARFVRNRILEITDDCPPPLCLATSRRVPMGDVPAFDEGITLAVGDRVALEPYPIYKGYWGSCARCFHIGPIPDDALKKAEAVDKAIEHGKSIVKPGIKTGEIMQIISDTLEDQGIKCTLDQAGHGVGLNFQEPPAIAVGEELRVEEGMVLAVECWYFDIDDMSVGKNMFGGEDYVVVTGDGYDPLPTFRTDLRCLGV